MNSVEVNTRKLLKIVAKNRTEHREVFLQAQTKYKAAVIAALEGLLDDARAGKRVTHRIELDAPQDHTRDYDRVIAMLGMSIDKSVTLSGADFECFVMDRWPWAAQFGANTLSYGIANKYLDLTTYEG